MSRAWEADEIQTAIMMRSRGISYEQIGERFNRTPKAARDIVNRNTPSKRAIGGYYNVDPIEKTKADTDAILDAEIGSEKLLRRLFEVFAPERMAA